MKYITAYDFKFYPSSNPYFEISGEKKLGATTEDSTMMGPEETFSNKPLERQSTKKRHSLKKIEKKNSSINDSFQLKKSGANIQCNKSNDLRDTLTKIYMTNNFANMANL